MSGKDGCAAPVCEVARRGDEASPEAETKPAAGVQRPLVRTTHISTTTIKLYRLMIFIRMGIFMLFFNWRITNAARMIRSTDGGDTSKMAAMWTLTIAGELWFAFMWVLDQLPKMMPVRRAVDAAALDESLLPTMDVFVTTADPDKEPPLTTANTVLSILAADYPANKVTCYVSDDAGAQLTREVVMEAARFAALWVPFCRKHGIEPRNPEVYLNAGGAGGSKVRVVARGSYKGTAWLELVRDRRRVQREYEEMRLRIDALQAGDVQRRRRSLADGRSLQRRGGTEEDHAGVVQALIGPAGHTPQHGDIDGNKLVDLTSVDTRLPALVYVCREKRRGKAHQRKAGAMNALLRASAVLSNAPFILNLDCDHYVNNSQALRASVCFMIERAGGASEDAGTVAFVQFPQRFDGVDPDDRYANHNRIFFNCTELGLDGLQGPIYVGTGCLFRRAALYGVDPLRWSPLGGVAGDAAKPAKFGESAPFLASVRVALNDYPEQSRHSTSPSLFLHDDGDAIAEASALVSCSYEDKTAWGRDIGWIYGTVTEDVVTGLCMHRRGWRSAYFAAAPDAFRGTAPINLTERLHQVLRWAAGSLEIFFSRNNALLAGRRLHPIQRVAYLNTTVYPFTSLFLLVYCLFPAVPLVAGDAATGMVAVPPTATYAAFLAAMILTLATVAVLEARWSEITLGEWWRNEQFWMVSATSAYLAAVAQVALKVTAGKEISFKLTSKRHATTATTAGAGGKEKDRYAELYVVRWTMLMVPTSAVLAVNMASMAARFAGGRWWDAPEPALGVAFNAWVVVHLYPFALGLMGHRSKAISPIIFLLGVVAYLTVRFLCLVLQFHTA
ncbi:hypothetical protein ABZP36_029928 [Zizania latifolia]